MLAGTIVASNYVAMAQVLARSYLAAHPDHRFVILVVDDGDAAVDDDRVDVWRLAALDLPTHELAAMLTMYDVREFSTAVKPAFLQALLERDDVACYIDPDIYVYAPFDDLVEVPARDHDIVLVPHVLRPVPRDGFDVTEEALRQSGLFNLGFVAVGRGAAPFLEWWGERLVTDAVVDLARGLFTDQRWVDWVPTLFQHTVCRDPGMDIAWWNAHERDVTIAEDDGETVPLVDGAPVRFVHYSGYDPWHPETFSHWQPRPRQSWEPGTPLRILAEQYGDELIASGHFERRRSAYQYDVADDGTPLTPDLRRIWRRGLLDELADGRSVDDARIPPAFGPRSDRFAAWLDGVGGGTVDDPHARRERGVWDRRVDLQRAFPDVDGSDAQAFRAWLDHEPDARTELGDFRPRWYAPQQEGERPTPRTVGARALAWSQRARSALARRAPASVPDRRDPSRPVAFLHVPKCGGTSLAQAVRAALPDRRWAPWTFDPDQFGPYAERELSDDLRERTIPEPGALRDFDAAFGHYSLTTLLARFDAGDIATVVREPRCRLLSHHQYWRHLDDDLVDAHDTWADINAIARELDFADWLADPRVAYQTDNLVARMLVPDHPAIPRGGFIEPVDVAAILAAAHERLDRLGWVDVLERGDAAWTDLGRWLGAPLRVARENVTVERVSRPNPVDQLLAATAAERLRERTVLDRAIWTAVADRRRVADPDGLADVEWSRRVAAAITAPG